MLLLILQRYEFSSKSQPKLAVDRLLQVVADTTKVRIFKQITTLVQVLVKFRQLLLILQRYEFSSKSQQNIALKLKSMGCCWYYKGTNFQANHNTARVTTQYFTVVADTTKVRIFKQITTLKSGFWSSICCCWYYKGTNFQANHNRIFAQHFT